MNKRSFLLSLAFSAALLPVFRSHVLATQLPDISSLLSDQDRISSEILNMYNIEENLSQFQKSTSFIDNAIDEDRYNIGMGDVFLVTILEMPSVNSTTPVNQNGDIYIPKIGRLKLGKISLREAKAKIVAFVHQQLKNRNHTVYVALQEGKKVRVTVNGSVTSPGTYFVDGIYRISDCLSKANKGTVPGFSENDLRSVTVRSADTTLQLDLMRYYLKNDISQNPYVYPGDIIFLPPAIHRVFVQGEVVKPLSGSGYVPIKSSETLGDLLDLLVLSGAADSGMIIVQKGSQLDRRDTIVSYVQAPDIILENMDVITIPTKPNYPKTKTVFISGEVARPGPYNCIENVTRAEDILSLCGGPTPKANVERAFIIRKNLELNNQGKRNSSPELLKIPDAQTGFTAGSIRPELNFAFSRLSNFQDYSVISLKRHGFSTILESNDQIVVPPVEHFVYVSGSVRKSGAYPYIKGKSCRDYIRDAGGFTSKSDRRSTYILTRYSASLQIKDGKTVEEGDIIVVPDSQRNVVMTDVVIPVLQIVSTLTTIVFAIFTMSNAN